MCSLIDCYIILTSKQTFNHAYNRKKTTQNFLQQFNEIFSLEISQTVELKLKKDP